MHKMQQQMPRPQQQPQQPAAAGDPAGQAAAGAAAMDMRALGRGIGASIGKEFADAVKGLAPQQPVAARPQAVKMEFKSFNGDPLKFWAFRARFEAIIASRSGYTDDDRILYLFQCCEGSAEEAIKQYQLLGTNYASVWAKLEQRFGCKQTIKKILLDKLRALSPCNETDVRKTREIHDAADAYVKQLQDLGIDLASEDTKGLLIPQLAHLLAPVYRRDYSKELRRLQRANKDAIMPIQEFFDIWDEGIRDAEAALPVDHGGGQRKGTATALAAAAGGKKDNSGGGGGGGGKKKKKADQQPDKKDSSGGGGGGGGAAAAAPRRTTRAAAPPRKTVEGSQRQQRRRSRGRWPTTRRRTPRSASSAWTGTTP